MVEARLELVVARDAVKEATPAETTGVVAAALEEDTVDEGTAREAVSLGMVHQLLPARLHPRARIKARSQW